MSFTSKNIRFQDSRLYYLALNWLKHNCTVPSILVIYTPRYCCINEIFFLLNKSPSTYLPPCSLLYYIVMWLLNQEQDGYRDEHYNMACNMQRIVQIQCNVSVNLTLCRFRPLQLSQDQNEFVLQTKNSGHLRFNFSWFSFSVLFVEIIAFRSQNYEAYSNLK